MELKTFLADLGKGIVEKGYVFSGEEEYLKEQAISQIRKLILAPGMEMMDEQVTEDVSPSARELNAMIGIPPLLSRRRLILIKDDPRFYARSGSKRDSKDEDQEEESSKKIGKTEKSGIQNALDHAGELCTVVFYNRGVISPNPWTKLISNCLKEVVFNPLSEKEAAPWVRRMARQAGLMMTPGTAEYLFAYVGGLLKSVESEMAKLAAYCGDAPADRDTVRNVCIESAEYRLFDMTDALMGGRSHQAIDSYYAMMSAGEEPLHLLAIIASQLRARARAREAFEAGISIDNIATALGTRPFVIERILRQPRDRTSIWNKAVIWCSDTDYVIKTGKQQPESAVELLFLRLVQEISG